MEIRQAWTLSYKSSRPTTNLKQRDIKFLSLTEGINTETSMGRFTFHIMSALAEMERDLIIERTRAGLAIARRKGRIGGRRPKYSEEQWAQMGRLLLDGWTREKVAIIFDVGISTLYRKFPASGMMQLDEELMVASEEEESNKLPFWEQALEED